MADAAGPLDEVVIRVPPAAGARTTLLLKFVPENVQVKVDVVIAIVSALVAVVWRHRAANVALVAVLDVLFGRPDWTVLFAALTCCPSVLMAQAIRSIKFRLYLLAVAVLAAAQVLGKQRGAPFVAVRTRDVRHLATAVWVWTAAAALVEAIKAGVEAHSALLTGALGVLALLASVKSLLRSRPASDYASLAASDSPR